MRNKYEVILWKRLAPGAGGKQMAVRRFKNARTAERWADKINEKHCKITWQTRSYRNVWVDIYKDGQGCIYELEPVYVDSVSDTVRKNGYAAV